MPPRDWTSPFEGGYYSRMAKRLTLVKTPNQKYLDELSHTDMPAVYKAINTIQRTGWRVNKKVLEVMEHVWEHSLGHGKLPKPEDEPLPPQIPEAQVNPEALKDWKHKAAAVYTKNRHSRSKRIHLSLTLATAQRFKDEEAIWFPYQMDFRGRLYSVSGSLNPQGSDYAKALLQFAEGKPVGNLKGAMWLAVHGANLFGYDKVSLDERSIWIEDNEEMIFECAKDPLANLWWTEADKPWQFLAFCFEWTGFRKQGFKYVSHLPVAMDGTCNGLQHFSAMLRDPVGGKAVNLLPSEKPHDIYQEVANVVIKRLEQAASTPSTGEVCPEESEGAKKSALAKKWLAFGITRKTCKRPVMTLPYGSTRYSCREFLEDWHNEAVADGLVSPFVDSKEVFTATRYLSDVVWEAIGDVVIAAREAMGWLQGAAQIVAKEGLPVCWTSPAGFPVQQAYREGLSTRITTALGDKAAVKLTVTTGLGEIDSRRSANGISPNFVHSLDAAALMLCVNLASDQAVSSFAMVHDSYATHASDADTLARCLRESFVGMYKGRDVLGFFRDEIGGVLSGDSKLPELPPQGSLDITEVLQSEFFFA
jgi:DNA-directed RNA polymerase